MTVDLDSKQIDMSVRAFGLDVSRPSGRVTERRVSHMNTIEEELMLGLEAQQDQQFEVAAASYQRILSEEPEHPETNHAVGLLLIANNQLIDAIPFLVKALERRPEVDHLWLDCMDAMIGAEQWDHGASLIERAREAGLPAEDLDLRDLRVLHGVIKRNLAKSA